MREKSCKTEIDFARKCRSTCEKFIQVLESKFCVFDPVLSDFCDHVDTGLHGKTQVAKGRKKWHFYKVGLRSKNDDSRSTFESES